MKEMETEIIFLFANKNSYLKKLFILQFQVKMKVYKVFHESTSLTSTLRRVKKWTSIILKGFLQI